MIIRHQIAVETTGGAFKGTLRADDDAQARMMCSLAIRKLEALRDFYGVGLDANDDGDGVLHS